MHRVLLFNKTKAPTRQELVSCERTIGELFFAPFKLTWAGYIVMEGRGRLCANWIIPDDLVESFHEFARTHETSGYELAVYTPGQNKFGGQQEQRVI